MSRKFFITGTDTHVGKTYFATQFIKALKQKGRQTVGIKPVATGCIWTGDAFKNEDALQLQEVNSLWLDYSVVNPLSFVPPIAPHIAAEQSGITLSVEILNKLCQSIFNLPHDVTLIEGAGGWFVPLNKKETWADFVAALDLEVILVVGMRLGCINHALLTLHAMQQRGVKIAGWVANQLSLDMNCYVENLETLRDTMMIPYIGEIKFMQNIDFQNQFEI